MKVLITGATGLVGARLLPRLVADGLDCHAVVRRPGSLPPGVTEVIADLFDSDSLRSAIAGVDAIIHLAAVFRTADTDLIWKTNLEGTRNLIAAAQQHAPGARFVMASTAHVYGTNSATPGREDDVITEPVPAYPASKLAAENLLRDSGLTWCIQRYGFIYGDQDGHLESLSGLAVDAGFHPAQRMSLIHHRDIATAMRLALNGALDGQVVNITDDAPTSVYELVQKAGGDMQPSSEALANPWHLHMDGSLARRLGFRPTVRTIDHAVELGAM
ncbi:NAD(P)-dependent oxidoreductase [Mycolicibacterium sp. P1-5]|uniref:NAD-dependent epimerase/dehydratase family protein n=1 Tax=Mycolicibacterium sp. P1-5 TaxID=2024617 RepID=UPI0011ED06DC|nr:NAD(P)-dependent oxidoreductase [Mycolicibacterium sp. P1-5]KAA0108108.1 NAD(P)-dependent oxidoreductase [Mycolicibacterium sp. P1-5]